MFHLKQYWLMNKSNIFSIINESYAIIFINLNSIHLRALITTRNSRSKSITWSGVMRGVMSLIALCVISWNWRALVKFVNNTIIIKFSVRNKFSISCNYLFWKGKTKYKIIYFYIYCAICSKSIRREYHLRFLSLLKILF